MKVFLLLLLPSLAQADIAQVRRLPGSVIYGERAAPMPVRVAKAEAGPITASVTDGTTTAVYEFVDATLGVSLEGAGGFTKIRRGSAPLHTKGWEASP